ncbi:MAG TPA: transcription termination/antitermination NusG family protein, partial [Thiotrichales bacterium]|nr:transcription termination/antitermination NusG family protein [Thiotrichales bacterium]
MRWYVVHAYSGYENYVKKTLQEYIDRANMQDHFGDILVPSE